MLWSSSIPVAQKVIRKFKLTSDCHDEIAIFTEPDPPQNVAVTPSSNNAADVTFDPPSTGDYDGFKIRVNGDVREILDADATSATIDSLESNVLYTFDVTSFVGIGGDEAESASETAELSLGNLCFANCNFHEEKYWFV